MAKKETILNADDFFFDEDSDVSTETKEKSVEEEREKTQEEPSKEKSNVVDFDFFDDEEINKNWEVVSEEDTLIQKVEQEEKLPMEKEKNEEKVSAEKENDEGHEDNSTSDDDFDVGDQQYEEEMKNKENTNLEDNSVETEEELELWDVNGTDDAENNVASEINTHIQEEELQLNSEQDVIVDNAIELKDEPQEPIVSNSEEEWDFDFISEEALQSSNDNDLEDMSETLNLMIGDKDKPEEKEEEFVEGYQLPDVDVDIHDEVYGEGKEEEVIEVNVEENIQVEEPTINEEEKIDNQIEEVIENSNQMHEEMEKNYVQVENKAMMDIEIKESEPDKQEIQVNQENLLPSVKDEEVAFDMKAIQEMSLGKKETITPKKKSNLWKILIPLILIVVLWLLWFVFKDRLLSIFGNSPSITTNQESVDNGEWEATNDTSELDEETEKENEDAKNKLLLSQKKKMEQAFPFYKVVSSSWISFAEFIQNNYSGIVWEKFDKILDPQIRESTVFLYQYKPQKLTKKKLISIMNSSYKGDKIAFKMLVNIYWKLNKKSKTIAKELKTKKWQEKLKKLLKKQIETNVPFVTSVNKELEAIANKSNNKLALFVYNNRVKDLRQTIVETKSSIQEILNQSDYVYFEKWLSLPELKGYNLKQEQKMTEILLSALLRNETLRPIFRKSSADIMKDVDNSSVLRDWVDLAYKIDFYHKYISEMLEMKLWE